MAETKELATGVRFAIRRLQQDVAGLGAAYESNASVSREHLLTLLAWADWAEANLVAIRATHRNLKSE